MLASTISRSCLTFNCLFYSSLRALSAVNLLFQMLLSSSYLFLCFYFISEMLNQQSLISNCFYSSANLFFYISQACRRMLSLMLFCNWLYLLIHSYCCFCILAVHSSSIFRKDSKVCLNFFYFSTNSFSTVCFYLSNLSIADDPSLWIISIYRYLFLIILYSLIFSYSHRRSFSYAYFILLQIYIFLLYNSFVTFTVCACCFSNYFYVRHKFSFKVLMSSQCLRLCQLREAISVYFCAIFRLTSSSNSIICVVMYTFSSSLILSISSNPSACSANLSVISLSQIAFMFFLLYQKEIRFAYIQLLSLEMHFQFYWSLSLAYLLNFQNQRSLISKLFIFSANCSQIYFFSTSFFSLKIINSFFNHANQHQNQFCLFLISSLIYPTSFTLISLSNPYITLHYPFSFSNISISSLSFPNFSSISSQSLRIITATYYRLANCSFNLLIGFYDIGNKFLSSYVQAELEWNYMRRFLLGTLVAILGMCFQYGGGLIGPRRNWLCL